MKCKQKSHILISKLFQRRIEPDKTPLVVKLSMTFERSDRNEDVFRKNVWRLICHHFLGTLISHPDGLQIHKFGQTNIELNQTYLKWVWHVLFSTETCVLVLMGNTLESSDCLTKKRGKRCSITSLPLPFIGVVIGPEIKKKSERENKSFLPIFLRKEFVASCLCKCLN